jgi:hypothetical protein
MKTYLSTQPVWLKPTAQIRALDGKSIVIVDHGNQTSARLRVSDADPQRRDAGMCSVIAWQASISPMNVKWADAGPPPSTSQAHQWEQYLTEHALALIHENKENTEYGDLVLEVPSDISQSE